ncbi:MAG: pilus assembly protein PilP [Deltaproteobacteria bacterium]|nr:pilus assembly protein PilP [Deltaproteobacteria bacterium]
MSKTPTLICLLLANAISVGCDDGKPPPKRSPTAAPRPAAAPRARVAKKPAKAPQVVELVEQDFVESPANRDPFRSFMSEFKAQTSTPVIKEQRNVKLKRYGLDELRLVAVITGEVRAQAMFRDPKGLGVAVRRGELISKSKARIKEISAGKVVVEIREEYEGGQKIADRVIELHAKGGKRP